MAGFVVSGVSMSREACGVADDLGRELQIVKHPQRIVSLCPSQTETLIRLGAPVVGRTRYCIHPHARLSSIAVVGGTKQIDFAAVDRLQPDLILAEKEENRREDVERLDAQYPVFVTDIRTQQAAVRMITSVGTLTGYASQAAAMRTDIEERWQVLPCVAQPLRVLYLIWRKPWMTVGADTYIHSVLTRLGLVNVAAQLSSRYPVLEAAQFLELAPDLILLSSEPYPFAEKHRAEISGFSAAPTQLVDGEMFSWYGARMIEAAPYLTRWLQSLGA